MQNNQEGHNQNKGLDYGNVAGLLLSMASNITSIVGLLAVTFAVCSLSSSLLTVILSMFKLLASQQELTWNVVAATTGINNGASVLITFCVLFLGILLRSLGRHLNSKDCVEWFESMTGKKN